DDITNITKNEIVTVPWGIFVGKNVRKQDGVTNVTGLSRYEVEAIFNRSSQTKDWRNLGYVVVDSLGAIVAPPNPITTCHRNAGSGSKAGFDQDVMVILPETTTQPGVGPGQAVFGDTSSVVANCLKDHPDGIAYLDADFELNFLPGGNRAG